MSIEELEYINNLPNEFPIFRGMSVKEYNSGDFGVSWTLKKEVEEYFAFKYGRNFSTKHLPKTVHKINIKKSKIIASLGERKEFELIYIHPVRSPAFALQATDG